MKIILLTSGHEIEAAIAVNSDRTEVTIKRLTEADVNCLYAVKVITAESFDDVLSYVKEENAAYTKDVS